MGQERSTMTRRSSLEALGTVLRGETMMGIEKGLHSKGPAIRHFLISLFRYLVTYSGCCFAPLWFLRSLVHNVTDLSKSSGNPNSRKSQMILSLYADNRSRHNGILNLLNGRGVRQPL